MPNPLPKRAGNPLGRRPTAENGKSPPETPPCPRRPLRAPSLCAAGTAAAFSPQGRRESTRRPLLEQHFPKSPFVFKIPPCLTLPYLALRKAAFPHSQAVCPLSPATAKSAPAGPKLRRGALFGWGLNHMAATMRPSSPTVTAMSVGGAANCCTMSSLTGSSTSRRMHLAMLRAPAFSSKAFWAMKRRASSP